jgi:uncharacterized membrane protein
MLPERLTQLKVSRRWDSLFAVLAIAAILALFLAPPHGLMDKADRIAFAVCHRIPARSFSVAGRPLPLCARCSGTYLGALAGLVALLLRGRGNAARLPSPKFLIVFALFLVAWAVDGLNSFLSAYPGAPHLYEPQNLLRLATGTLEGLAIAAVLLPAFNRSLWTRPVPIPSVGHWQDLAWMLVAGAVLAALVIGAPPILLYPMAILSGLAVVILLAAVNIMFVLVALRRDGRLTGWHDAWQPLLLGLALAAGELVVVGLARTVMEAWLGPPW